MMIVVILTQILCNKIFPAQLCVNFSRFRFTNNDDSGDHRCDDDGDDHDDMDNVDDDNFDVLNIEAIVEKYRSVIMIVMMLIIMMIMVMLMMTMMMI